MIVTGNYQPCALLYFQYKQHDDPAGTVGTYYLVEGTGTDTLLLGNCSIEELFVQV